MQTKKFEKYQPRYVAYAKYHNNTPQLMLEIDQKKYFGACMSGYIQWINSKWNEWKKIVNKPLDQPIWKIDHLNFDAWLNNLDFSEQSFLNNNLN